MPLNANDLNLIPTGSDYVTYNQLENASQLTVAVYFVGETNQITRLFPQSILRGMGYPLDLQVTLKVSLRKRPLLKKGHITMLIATIAFHIYSDPEGNRSKHCKGILLSLKRFSVLAHTAQTQNEGKASFSRGFSHLLQKKK